MAHNQPNQSRWPSTVLRLSYYTLPCPLPGLMVLERNWLEVYPWGNWGGNANLPTFHQGQTFMPTELLLKEGATQPPPRLSERDLISAMERYGIGERHSCTGPVPGQQLHGPCTWPAAATSGPCQEGDAG